MKKKEVKIEVPLIAEEKKLLDKVELASKVVLKEDEALFKLMGQEKQGMNDGSLLFAEQRQEETDIEKMEREIKEKKKLLKQKRKEEEERVKKEELEKQVEEERIRKAQEEELLKKQDIIPPTSQVPINREDKFLLLPNENMLKVCPNCNNPKLKKSWVRKEGMNIKQKFRCKACGFKTEIIMRI